MKNLKITIVLVSLFMLSCTNLNAQTGSNKFDDAKFEKSEELAKDIKKISLSSTQTEGFKAITKKYVIQLESLLEKDDKGQDINLKMKDIQLQKNAEMKSFLTEEQYSIYIKIQEERELKKKNKV